MREKARDIDKKVAIATLNAKAYYTLSSFLKDLKIPFISAIPGQDIDANVTLVLTTTGEMDIVSDRNLLFYEDIINNFTVAKERIFSILYNNKNDALMIGIDPGLRTGIVASYCGKTIFGKITSSFEEILTNVSFLINSSHAKSKVIRIGDGDHKLAVEIAEKLSSLKNENLVIEIVDERRTTRVSSSYIREQKDLRSARIISLRKGKIYYHS
ncbi:MAG TPA: hypothetical protein VIH27_02850 [Nitrososphaerales archaeon]